MKKALKILGLSVVSLVVLLFALLSGRAILDKQIDYEVDLAGTEIPRFVTIELPHDHSYSDATSLPVTGGAAIDGLLPGRIWLFCNGGRSDIFAVQANATFPARMGDSFSSCAHRFNIGNPGSPHMPGFAFRYTLVLFLTDRRLAAAAGIPVQQAFAAGGQQYESACQTVVNVSCHR